MKSFKGARGFSLLEVLVAIVVVATGVLGVGSLQVLSMQNDTSALLRTQANGFAYDIIDRARANPHGSYLRDLGDAPPAARNCVNQDCTPSEMSDYDMGLWLGEVATSLPEGDAAITSNGSLVTVTVQWDDDRSAGSAPLRLSMTTALAQ